MDTPFDEQLICEYLLDNPDFFSRHPELLKNIQIPHQQKGVVSLVEKRQEILHHKVCQLEEEITSLMNIASWNEKIFHFNNQLSLAMLKCKSLLQLQYLISEKLRSEFNFSHVLLVNIDDGSILSNIWQKRLHSGHYFGRLPIQEAKEVFNADVGSVALTKLNNDAGRFIFAIASTDAMHFNPEMDNTLLEQLRQLLDHLLPKIIHKKIQ